MQMENIFSKKTATFDYIFKATFIYILQHSKQIKIEQYL